LHYANDAKTFLKHFSDCLFYFCSTCADSITERFSCITETAAVSQKAAAPVAELEPAVIEEELAPTAPCQEKFYWITTLPSGERSASSCCDQTDVSVINATVCVMTDPLTSQVNSPVYG